MSAVEWKKLGDVCEILDSQRKPISKSKRVFGSYPYYGANGIQDYVDGYIFDGTYLLVGEDGSVINKDNSPVLHWVSGQFWVNNHAHILSDIKDAAILKYLYYVLHTIDVSDIVRGVPPKLNQENLKNIVIPIPSLAKQQEIVSHLDTFTTLISNLENELDMRRKQYEHYRNQLLDFDGVEGVEWKTLGDVAINRDRMRKPITASKRVAGIYPYYGASGIVDYVEGYIFDGNYLLISEDGANLIARSTPIAFPISGKTWVNNHAHVLEFNNLITQRLIEIYLNSIDLTKYISGGAQPKLNQENLNSILIPIPSLATQQEIVSKLDAFENLIQSLEQEIKLRKQQYEYYREKLLTFE